MTAALQATKQCTFAPWPDSDLPSWWVLSTPSTSKNTIRFPCPTCVARREIGVGEWRIVDAEWCVWYAAGRQRSSCYGSASEKRLTFRGGVVLPRVVGEWLVEGRLVVDPRTGVRLPARLSAAVVVFGRAPLPPPPPLPP